ncbi:diguanylate cyclase [Vibrio sp. MA40-2]|uniref:diguanylate cyclase n=1 Tax=Vibrio sp. MA40-2 TaxID=3391828 RepID=UPI0039A6BA16
MRTISLRQLIITPFVLLTLAAGIIMYLVSTVTISNITYTVGLQYIKEVEHRIYDRVYEFTSPLITILDINRTAFYNKPEMLSNLDLLTHRFYEQGIPYPHITFISVATTDGRYMASTQDPILKNQSNIAANYVNKPFIMQGFEHDPKQFIGQKIKEHPTFSYDPRVRPFYQNAVAKRDVVWSDIHPYFGYPALGVGLSAPIYDQADNLIGVTATSLALIELDDYLQSLELVEGTHVFISELNGDLIATSEQNQLYKKSNDMTVRVNLSNHPNKILQAASHTLKSGTHHLNTEQGKYLYYVRPIALKYEKTWLLGILIPQSHHQRILSEYTQTTLVITFILFIVIAFIGSLIAWCIGKPIHTLCSAVSQNNVKSIQEIKQPLSSVKEINTLGKGLNSMANTLSDVMHNLEQKVMERTSHLQDENQNLLEDSVTDELTSLYNRRGLKQTFQQTLEYTQQHNQRLTFVICDIDHFKNINDKYGHVVGDQALVLVANIFKKHIRNNYDIVARYGGEEFALIFIDTDTNTVIKRLNDIRHELAITPIDDDQYITISFGVVHITDTTNVSTDTLFKQADEKLYHAKNTGRDKIVM